MTREVIARTAVANAGVRGADIRAMMPEAVETRFGAVRAPRPVEWLLRHRRARHRDRNASVPSQPNPVARFTPVASPQNTGMRAPA